MKRENRLLESFKSLNETKARLAKEEEDKIAREAADVAAFRNKYYAMRDMRNRKDNTRATLMEAARNDAFGTVLKAIYITALEADMMTRDGILLAESMVDTWIAENGGATKILNKVKGNTYLLSRISQIVEDAAEATVKEIEAEDDEPVEDTEEKKDDAVDAANDFLKDADKEEVKDFIGQVIDSIQTNAEDKGEEKAAEDNVDAPTEPEGEEKVEEPENDESEKSTTEEPEEVKDEEVESPEEKEVSDEVPAEDEPAEDSESSDDPEVAEEEEPADTSTDEESGDKAIDLPSAEKDAAEAEEPTEDSGEEDTSTTPDDIEATDDEKKESEDANNDANDTEVSVEPEDDEVEATDSENGTPDTDIDDSEEVESEEDPLDGSDDEESEEKDDEEKELEDDLEDEDIDDELGEPIDDDGIDNDISVDGETDSTGKVFDDLDKEEDVQKAIELIRTRVADAEETFIRNNAEDKKQIDELLNKISNNVKTVEDLSDKNSAEDKTKKAMAEESARMSKRAIDSIRENRPLTVFEKMTRNLTKDIIKSESVREQYISESGNLDTERVVESSRVMYGFLETLNTLQLEKIDENYIKKVVTGQK